MVAADNVLATILSKEASADSVATDNVEKIADAADANVSEADSLLAELGQDKKDTEANQSMEEFAKQHPLFALLQISQYNGQLSPGSTVGIAQAKDMEKISEYLNMKQVKEVLPRNLALKWGVKAIDDKEQFFELYALKVTNTFRFFHTRQLNQDTTRRLQTLDVRRNHTETVDTSTQYVE